MDRQEANQAINWMEHARRSAAELRGYRHMGSVVVAWGLAWITGFGALQFAPRFAGWLWLLAWCGALGWMLTRPWRTGDGRALATWGLIVAYVALVLLVVRGDARTVATVSALTLSAGFSILGLWTGHRYLVLGAAVAVTLLVGCWFAPRWLFLLLALGGGGSLVAGGFWLQRP